MSEDPGVLVGEIRIVAEAEVIKAADVDSTVKTESDEEEQE